MKSSLKRGGLMTNGFSLNIFMSNAILICIKEDSWEV